MKVLYLLTWMSLVGLVQSANAQTPTKRLFLGPALAVDHFTSQSQTDAPTDIRYATAISYGLDLSYLTGRILLHAQLLTAQRSYDLQTNIQAVELNDPLLLSRVRLSTRTYSLPIGIAYRLITGHRVQVFGGVGALAEWQPQSFRREAFNLLGQPSLRTLPDPVRPKTLSVGGSLQLKVRYQLNEHVMVQFEPAFHYFPAVHTPYISGYKRGLSALVSLGYGLF